MTPSDEVISVAIAVKAGEWYVANQAGTLGEEDRTAFLSWLKASPIHIREYLGVANIAHQLSAVLGSPQVPIETFLNQVLEDGSGVASIEVLTPKQQRPTAQSPTSWSWSVVTSTAAALALSVAGALWWAHDGELLGIPKSYRTAHGEQRVERLPDGSVLRLDSDSEAMVRYSGGERLVELKLGQAMFEVAHESQRRFRVVADYADAIAVGTQFNVYRKTGTIEFTVAQGEIAVFTREPALRNAAGLPSAVQHVTAGYQLRIDKAAAASQLVPVNLEEALGWVQHKIVFEHRPLGEVAAEFNRYGRVPVAIEDPSLQSLPASGLFDAADTDSFVAFLQTLPGVSVERTSARIRVIRIATAPRHPAAVLPKEPR